MLAHHLTEDHELEGGVDQNGQQDIDDADVRVIDQQADAQDIKAGEPPDNAAEEQKGVFVYFERIGHKYLLRAAPSVQGSTQQFTQEAAVAPCGKG